MSGGVGPGGRFRHTFSQRQVAIFHEQRRDEAEDASITVPRVELARTFEPWFTTLVHDVRNDNPAVPRVRVTTYGDASAAAIAVALKSNTCVTTWDLHDSAITDVGARAVAAAMQPAFNRTVSTLDLHSNCIEYSGCHALVHGLRHNSSLRHLDLRDNNIGDAGLQAFAGLVAGQTEKTDALHSCPLLSLDVSANCIGDIGAQAFLRRGLPTNTVLQSLCLGRNRITDVSADAIGSTLQVGSIALQELNLAANRVSDATCLALAHALGSNKCLQKLDLSHNRVGDEGAAALAGALSHNGTLTELRLASNLVTDEGCTALAQSLAKPTRELAHGLRVLDLSDCKILNPGALALAAALRSNSSLEVLGLRSNQISSMGCEAFADVLRQNATLVELDLDLNQITTAEALRDFVPVLTEANTTLRVLRMGANIAHSVRLKQSR
jgi:Ran GTPase-activating protein (RanGAP) involved in mRNA processing and transport